ncbi:MAG: GHKL domain-containing protein [Bacilli bacterium]|nr:GHKL domain-containing protein [Bacilli bacterium]
MEIISKYTYMTFVLMCQMVFLWNYPKQKMFVPKLIGSFASSIVTWRLLSLLEEHTWTMLNPIGHFFVLFISVLMSSVYYLWTFKASWVAIFNGCMAGVAFQHIGFNVSLLIRLVGFPNQYGILIEFLCCLLLVACCFVPCGRYIKRYKCYENIYLSSTIIASIVVLVSIGLTRLKYETHVEGNKMFTILISSYAIISCSLAVFLQFTFYSFFELRKENEIIRRMRDEEAKQYRLAKENYDLINIKAHDIKHFMSHLKEEDSSKLEDIKTSIQMLENFYDTGFVELDVVLNEKARLCASEGISFTYMGDSASLKFMNELDIYSLFGNIIDNAIEAVREVSCKERKTISLVVENKGGITNISCINYSIHTIDPKKGIPTSKKKDKDYHGYGLKSIKRIAEKYGGDVNISCEHHTFNITVYLLPE